LRAAVCDGRRVTGLEIVVAIVILVGLVGVVVPVLPGMVLVWGAVLVWAIATAEPVGWAVLAVVTLLLGAGLVVKYLVPGKRMKDAGIPGRTLWLGGAGAVIGFFAIPVVGTPVGFVLGVYLAELQRLGSEQAWPSTKHALKATGLSMLIELTATGLAAGAWGAGVAAT
jgi:uncharacterized protein YqgC (DUF456 family)